MGVSGGRPLREEEDPLIIFDTPLDNGDAYAGHEGDRPRSGEDVPYWNRRKIRRWVEKRWGSEEIIVNNAAKDYCGKIITIEGGKKTSYHYHPVKDETFYVLEGDLYLYWGTETAIEGVVHLKAGERFRMQPGTCHCLCNRRRHPPLRLIEFSTYDDADDSIRVEFPE